MTWSVQPIKPHEIPPELLGLKDWDASYVRGSAESTNWEAYLLRDMETGEAAGCFCLVLNPVNRSVHCDTMILAPKYRGVSMLRKVVRLARRIAVGRAKAYEFDWVTFDSDTPEAFARLLDVPTHYRSTTLGVKV